jgi:hypothetical protein
MWRKFIIQSVHSRQAHRAPSSPIAGTGTVPEWIYYPQAADNGLYTSLTTGRHAGPLLATLRGRGLCRYGYIWSTSGRYLHMEFIQALNRRAHRAPTSPTAGTGTVPEWIYYPQVADTYIWSLLRPYTGRHAGPLPAPLRGRGLCRNGDITHKRWIPTYGLYTSLTQAGTPGPFLPHCGDGDCADTAIFGPQEADTYI